MRNVLTAASIAALVLIAAGSATADMTTVTYDAYVGDDFQGIAGAGAVYEPSYAPFGKGYKTIMLYDPVITSIVTQDTVTYDDDLYILSFVTSPTVHFEQYQSEFVTEYRWHWTGVFPPSGYHMLISMYSVFSTAVLQGTTTTPELTVIPAPGAVILGSIGLGLVGWWRRRR